MASHNITWGEERIASEFLFKLGVRHSPGTVRCYTPSPSAGRQRGPSSLRWRTFVRNHAQGTLTCDFFVTVTAGFQLLYVFLVMKIETRRTVRCNVASHPSAGWAVQQFREVLRSEKPYRFLIHDRNSIYSSLLDSALAALA